MFEDSMLESAGKIKSKSKYWMILTFGINLSILAAMIIVPLLYPEALPKNSLTASLTAPPPPPPPTPTPPKAVQAAPSEIDQTLRAPAKIPKDIKMMHDTAAPPPASSASANFGSSGAGNPASLLGGDASGTGAPGPAVVVAKPAGPVRISGGVMAGQIQNKVNPVYPAIARSARLSGTVVLSAKISKSGSIEDLSVISGPAMLTGAAIDAVKQWKYKPYLLNGEPTEVNTTVTVNFNLNSGG